MNDKNIIIGTWKFSENVKREEIVQLAKEWAENDQYLFVAVRKASETQTGISFAHVSDGSKDFSDKYNLDTKDLLYRRFGTGLVGWDISTTHDIFKGF